MTAAHLRLEQAGRELLTRLATRHLLGPLSSTHQVTSICEIPFTVSEIDDSVLLDMVAEELAKWITLHGYKTCIRIAMPAFPFHITSVQVQDATTQLTLSLERGLVRVALALTDKEPT